jgi:hypothetical protein
LGTESHQTRQWLDFYFVSLMFMFISILLLVPCHLDVLHWELPIVHYLAAGLTFSFGQLAICSYLAVIHKLDMSNCFKDSSFLDKWDTWTTLTRVNPVCKLVLGLHAMAIAAGLAKVLTRSEALSLLFGFCEVAVILGYQLFLYSFEADDRFTRRSAVVAQDRSCRDDSCAPLVEHNEVHSDE